MSRTAIILAALAAAFLFVGKMDYEDQRARECDRHGKDYNPRTDVCVAYLAGVRL